VVGCLDPDTFFAFAAGVGVLGEGLVLGGESCAEAGLTAEGDVFDWACLDVYAFRSEFDVFTC